MTVNLTFDIADILGTDFDARRTKVWLQTNIEGDVIIDATGNTIRLGHARATINTDGTGSFTGLPATNGATNPTAFQYQVHIDYPDRDAHNGRGTWASGWFPLTATADLAGVAAEAYVPPTWVSTFTASMEAIRDEAEAARDEAVDISGISTSDGVVDALLANPASDTSVRLSATYVATVKKPTGVAATDAANLQAAHDALPATGGRLELHPGEYNLGTNLLAFTKPVTIRGGGGRLVATNQGGTFPGSAITTIKSASANGKALSLASPGCTFVDFAVINSSPLGVATGSTGIYMENGHNFSMTRVTVQGFYDCVRVEGRFGAMNDCHVYDPIRYGLLMTNDNTGEQDFGDQGISNCVFAMYGRQLVGGADAAVRWESAGGIRWSNNKIVAGSGPGATGICEFKYGLDIAVADGSSTVEFMIQGGAISTCSIACLRIGQQAGGSLTGNMLSITVAGVVFQGYGSTAKGIQVGAGDTNHVNNIRDVYIGGNSFKNVLSGGIELYNCRQITIAPNNFGYDAYTGPLITLAGGNDNSTGTQHVDIAKQNVGRNLNVEILRDNRYYSTNYGSVTGIIDLHYDAEMNITAINTPKSAFTIQPVEAGGTQVEVTVTGWTINAAMNSYERRPVLIRQRRFITQPYNGGTVTLSTLGTDEATGTGAVDVTVGYDVATSGAVTVTAKTTDSSRPVFQGRVEVRVDGKVKKFTKVAA